MLSNPSMRYLIEMCLACLGKPGCLGKAFLLCKEMPQLPSSTLCLSSRTQTNCLISSKFDNNVEVSKMIAFQGIMALYLSRAVMFGFYNLFFPQFPQKKDKSICSLLAATYGWDKAAAHVLLLDLHRSKIFWDCLSPLPLARQDQHQ